MVGPLWPSSPIRTHSAGSAAFAWVIRAKMNMADRIISEKCRRFRNDITARSDVTISFMPGLCICNCEACADRHCGELIDRIAAGEPIRELLSLEALGDMGLPLPECRSDHRAKIDLAAVDADRAAEAAADIESCLDHRIS